MIKMPMPQLTIIQGTVFLKNTFHIFRTKKDKLLNSRVTLPSLLLSIFLCLTACGTPDTPQIITEKFWQSISTQNFGRAEKLSLNNFLTPGLKNLDISDFKIDSIRIKNNQAKINTLIWLNERDQVKEIQLITHLVQQDEQWFVDTVKTMDSRLPGALHNLFKSLEEVKDGFIESLKKSAEDMEDQIPEIENDLQSLGNELINEFDEVLDEILPKIESAVEKSLDEMNDALEELEQLERKQPSDPAPSNNGNKII